MNIINNQRYQSTEEKIQKALFSLLKFRKYNDISIKEICYEAGINRSSFYAHYQDINDLMIKIEQNLSKNIKQIFSLNNAWDNTVFENMFNFIYENKNFYLAYLTTNEQPFMERNDFIDYCKFSKRIGVKYNYSERETIYHMTFFAGGLKAICKNWLLNGCKETPQQMAKIIKNEYDNRH